MLGRTQTLSMGTRRWGEKKDQKSKNGPHGEGQGTTTGGYKALYPDLNQGSKTPQ